MFGCAVFGRAVFGRWVDVFVGVVVVVDVVFSGGVECGRGMPEGAARVGVAWSGFRCCPVGVVRSDEWVVHVATVGEGVDVGVPAGGPFVDVVDL